jgi:hypothetical protein
MKKTMKNTNKTIKRLALLLAPSLLLALLLSSCSLEESCGTVDGFSVNQFSGEYLIWVDGASASVDFATWLKTDMGEYICLYW